MYKDIRLACWPFYIYFWHFLFFSSPRNERKAKESHTKDRREKPKTIQQSTSVFAGAKLIMEDQCSPFNWDFCAFEDEGMEELWYSLLCRTSELETKVASAREEIIKKEDELVHLKDFLSRAIKERDEAELKCQSIMLDIFTLQQQLQQQKHQQKQQKEEEIGAQNVMEQQAKESHLVDQHFSNCFETESEKESRGLDLPPSAEKLVAGKALPEKGKLLQAVMEAGPLLQTLLLAGPLPQWQHPPPRVDSREIPPVAMSRPPRQSFLCQDSSFSHKRSPPHSADSVFNSNTKYQRVLY